jgi:aminopeptidase 2
MCKHSLAAEVVSSGVDISQSREVLPKNVKPLHYHLTLEPNLETFEYDGEVVIECVTPPD